MPEQAPHQDQFVEENGALVPEAPLSQLRREIINPGIEGGKLAQAAKQGAVRREAEEPNAVRADTGYNDERAEEPLPKVVTKGYAPLLGRVVMGDHDIREQEAIVAQIAERRAAAKRSRMDPKDVERNLRQIDAQRIITDPDGEKARKASRRAEAKAADEARHRMPPPGWNRPA